MEETGESARKQRPGGGARLLSSRFNRVIRVAELITYPIKGCAGVSVSDISVTAKGLAHDRTFMVVDKQGLFRSQRRDPRLALIRPSISADGALHLQAPGANDIQLTVDSTSAPVDVRVFDDECEGIDQGDVAAEWFSHVLGAPSRLVYLPPAGHRLTDGWAPGMSGYADSAAVHILSYSSLTALNQRIAAAGRRPLAMTRFRPNIVLDGWGEPHREDWVREMRVGQAEFVFAKTAIRCAVTLVDQSTGVAAGPEPLKTLATYRRTSRGGVAFGAKFSVIQPGKLTIGDEMTVTAWGGPDM